MIILFYKKKYAIRNIFETFITFSCIITNAQRIINFCFRFRNGFVNAFCSCPWRPCKRFRTRHSHGGLLKPVTHFAMTGKGSLRNGDVMHSVTYYNSRHNGIMKPKCLSEDEYCV